jgi:hypothetical protein
MTQVSTQTAGRTRSLGLPRAALLIAVLLFLAVCAWLWMTAYVWLDERQIRPNTNAVRIADLDGDGDLDAFLCQGAIVPNSYNSVMIRTDAGGLVTSGQRLGEANCRVLSLADLDSDGDLDAAGSGFPMLMLYMNDGTRDISKRSTGIMARGIWTHAVGDLDGDGDLDILLGGCCNPESLYITAVVNQTAGGGVPGRFVEAGWKLDSLGTEAIALGDLDGDGDLDAFLANGFLVNEDFQSVRDQPNMVAWNDGSGVFSDSQQRLGLANSKAVALGDLDGDGDLDAFVGNAGADEVWINMGGTQGGTPGIFIDSGQRLGNSHTKAVLLVDLDGDGDLDAVVTRQSTFRTRPQIYLNDGSGSFRLSYYSRWHSVLGTAFDAAYFNGNGHMQLIGAAFEDRLRISR